MHQEQHNNKKNQPLNIRAIYLHVELKNQFIVILISLRRKFIDLQLWRCHCHFLPRPLVCYSFVQPMYVCINNAAIIFFLFVYLILSFQKKNPAVSNGFANRSPIRHFNYASLFDMHHCICTHAVNCTLGRGFCTRTMFRCE